VHRHQHGIHGTFAHDADGVHDGIAVHHGETAAAGRLNARAFAGKQNGGNRG
jgi:hypothetical protein